MMGTFDKHQNSLVDIVKFYAEDQGIEMSKTDSIKIN
jgi:hypothetical protein